MGKIGQQNSTIQNVAQNKMKNTITPNFKKQKATILQLPDDTWLLQIGCPAFRFIFDTPQEMLAQYVAILSDPEKWLYENKAELGNKKLKEVDLHVISKYIENN